MKNRIVGLIALVAAGLLARPAQAVKVQVGEDSFAEVRLLAQAWAQGREDGAADGRSTGVDFYLRRARLMLFGNVTKDISFFIETDAPNFGKGGNFNSSIYVQDAIGSFRLLPELTVDTGLIIIPLTHHTYQGATTLNTLDYHAFLVKYPKDSTKVWRDVGVQLRGLLFDDRIQYRAGVFGGVRGSVGRLDDQGAPLPDVNPHSRPRFAANVRYNLFDPEPDLFLQGIYLGKRKVVSFGVAVDYQSQVVSNSFELADYLALGGDVFVDIPFAQDQELVFQANVLNYRQGKQSSASGTGLFAEAGWRYHRVEPVVAFERFFSKTGGQDFQGWHLGFNWWFHDHLANLKVDFAVERDAALQKVANLEAARDLGSLTMQTQIYF